LVGSTHRVVPKREKVWARTGWRWVHKKVFAGYRTVQKRVLAYRRLVKARVIAGYRTVTRRRVVGYRTVKKPEVVGWRTVPVYPAGNDTPHSKGPGLAAPVPHGEQPPYPPPGTPEAALIAGALIAPGKQYFSFDKLARALDRDKTYPASRIHHNLCGELTLSYLLNASPLAFLYTWWLLLDLPFERQYNGDPTGADDLMMAFLAYGYGARQETLDNALARLKAGEPTRIVVGVKLDTKNGYIAPEGDVRHWSAAVGTVEGDQAYVFLPHEGRVEVMSLDELAERKWGPGGREQKVKIVVPEEENTKELGEDVEQNKKTIQKLVDTGQPLVLIYNPYENRYELMTKAYLQQSQDLSVMVASPVTDGGDG